MRALTAVLTFLALAAPAAAQGTGENLELVANHRIEEGVGTDIELGGDHAFVGYFGGFVIVDISDPRNPRRAGTVECGGGGHDIAVNPELTIAVLAADDSLNSCGEGGGVAIFDVTDKTRPRQISSITTPVGAHTATLDGHVLSVNNYAHDIVELYDLSDPASPRKLAETTTPGPSAFHDSYFDHRPDGKVLLYGASGEGHDVFDVTDPSKPAHLQRVMDPEVTFSHQLEPNHQRDVMIASEEWMGGGAAGVCGKVPGADVFTPLPGLGLATDYGALHFYAAAPTGLFTNTVPEKLSTFNLPFEAPQASGCTSHVFWQAPDANRLVIAWYVKGTRVLDFSDPAAPREIGWFVADGADTWAAKPHKGYIFTGDLARGMDVLRYTGDGWPKDAPGADVQRLAQQGFAKRPAAPAPPGTPGPGVGTRRTGRVSFSRRLRVPGRRGRRVKLTLSFVDAGNAVVGTASVRKRTGRARLRVTGVAEAGRYRYVVRLGRRILARGRFTVRAGGGGTLPAGRVISARAR